MCEGELERSVCLPYGLSFLRNALLGFIMYIHYEKGRRSLRRDPAAMIQLLHRDLISPLPSAGVPVETHADVNGGQCLLIQLAPLMKYTVLLTLADS